MPTAVAFRCFARASGREAVAGPQRRVTADRANVRAAVRRGRNQQICGCVRNASHAAALSFDKFPTQSQIVGFIRREVDMLQTVAGDATFGPGPTFNTDTGFKLDLSPDKKTFTATFDGLEVMINGT